MTLAAVLPPGPKTAVQQPVRVHQSASTARTITAVMAGRQAAALWAEQPPQHPSAHAALGASTAPAGGECALAWAGQDGVCGAGISSSTSFANVAAPIPPLERISHYTRCGRPFYSRRLVPRVWFDIHRSCVPALRLTVPPMESDIPPADLEWLLRGGFWRSESEQESSIKPLTLSHYQQAKFRREQREADDALSRFAHSRPAHELWECARQLCGATQAFGRSLSLVLSRSLDNNHNAGHGIPCQHHGACGLLAQAAQDGRGQDGTSKQHWHVLRRPHGSDSGAAVGDVRVPLLLRQPVDSVSEVVDAYCCGDVADQLSEFRWNLRHIRYSAVSL